MPRNRPTTTGYERLAQADQFSDESDDDDFLARSAASLQPASAPRYAPVTQPRPHSGMASPKGARGAGGSGSRGGNGRRGNGRRQRSNSGVDLRAINARLERWADEIASKFKRGRGRGRKGGDDDDDDDQLPEIHHSVFQAPEGVRPATAEALATPEPGYMTKAEFETLVDSVRTAIGQGMHPRMISQGSSGSYFARTPDGRVVGVFKPKDEEPYAAGNPKWNKWIHRNLFPCCFGRACLIPNLSYVSEAAAYVLDVQLRTHLVPYTDVVYLSSKSFHYPFWDRYNYSRKRKPLPAKPGSFQVFLKGFKDANVFLREHPWPDHYYSSSSGLRTSGGGIGGGDCRDPHGRRKKRWADNCRPSSLSADGGGGDSDEEGEGSAGGNSSTGAGRFVWTESLKQSFREELEKLVILDYIMRNTDRGLDNWMVKIDWETQQVSIASDPVHLNMDTGPSDDGSGVGGELGPRPVDLTQREPPRTRAPYPYRTQKPMEASSSPGRGADPGVSIGAIDNSLSWPWKHPDAWRSFPFGWLFLPVDLIGRPFSQKTRDHFLPLLTSTQWWRQTQLALRKVFQIDSDFQERMFARQMAVMKGQAWNVVETLKMQDHGPLELTRRAKVCVWDDLVDVPVAVPMRATSADMRRYAAQQIDEEMDLGAGVAVVSNNNNNNNNNNNGRNNASSAPASAGLSISVDNGALDGDDLLGLATPPANIPHPGRFELASPTTAETQSLPRFEGAQLDDPLGALSGATGQQQQSTPTTTTAATTQHHAARPTMPRTSLSQQAPRSLNMYSPERQREQQRRRFSFANSQRFGSGSGSGSGSGGGAAARRASGEGGSYYGVDDDLEGDLGYAAAQGMEGNQRKVIVERLEMVKTNPVFTWC